MKVSSEGNKVKPPYQHKPSLAREFRVRFPTELVPIPIPTRILGKPKHAHQPSQLCILSYRTAWQAQAKFRSQRVFLSEHMIPLCTFSLASVKC